MCSGADNPRQILFSTPENADGQHGGHRETSSHIELVVVDQRQALCIIYNVFLLDSYMMVSMVFVTNVFFLVK